MKTITKIIYLAFATLALVCFGLSPIASAATTEAIPEITPTPDGCYPGFNTAEGCQALLNINTASGQGNTGLGFAALKFLTSGDSNTAVGVNSLLNLTTAIQNTAVGRGALQRNNANGETAVGFRALASNTTGGTAGGGGIAQFGPNTAVGTAALASNTIGNSNTAVGFAALGSNTATNFSTAVGFRALASFRFGLGSNSAFGYKALEANTSGNFNVSVGNLSLFNNTDGDENMHEASVEAYRRVCTATATSTSGLRQVWLLRAVTPTSTILGKPHSLLLRAS